MLDMPLDAGAQLSVNSVGNDLNAKGPAVTTALQQLGTEGYLTPEDRGRYQKSAWSAEQVSYLVDLRYSFLAEALSSVAEMGLQEASRLGHLLERPDIDGSSDLELDIQQTRLFYREIALVSRIPHLADMLSAIFPPALHRRALLLMNATERAAEIHLLELLVALVRGEPGASDVLTRSQIGRRLADRASEPLVSPREDRVREVDYDRWVAMLHHKQRR